MSDQNLSPQLRKKYTAALVESHGFEMGLGCFIGMVILVSIVSAVLPGSPAWLAGITATLVISSFFVVGSAKSGKKREVEAMPNDRLLHDYKEMRKAQSHSTLFWTLGIAALALVLVFTPRGNAFLNGVLSYFLDGASK